MFLVLGIAASSCASLHPAGSPRALQEDEGLVFIYLQPITSGAGRLAFSLGSVTALRDDGREFPLMLRMTDLPGSGAVRQRLLASGALPQGSYTGFSLTVTKATLAGEEEARLLVPDAPVPVPFPFQVSAGKAQVLSADFNYAKSLTAGMSFTPVFTISIPFRPVTAVHGYVSGSHSQALMVFDKNTPRAFAAVATGRGPRGLAFDQQQKRIYAALEDNDAVDVIDANSGEQLRRIRLNYGDGPVGLALAPDGRTLFAVNHGSNCVSVIDTSLEVEITRIPVGDGPEAILLDRAGRRAYVFNTLSNSISVIDVANRAVAASLATDPAPVWGQFSPQGDRFYIICAQSAYMTILDPVRLVPLSRGFVGIGLDALKVDAATGLIYAGRKNVAAVDVYDPALLVPVDSIPTGEGPSYLTIDGEGNTLWLVAPGTGRLIAVSLTSRKVVAEIDAGDEPYWLVLAGER